MSPQKPSNITTANHEYCNITETQEKDLKTTNMKMVEVLKEKNKEICENTNCGRKWIKHSSRSESENRISKENLN